ncbi:MAG: hypothetical protein IJT13_01480 [Bacteroidaceae bacterium]|nr:hypothetical protein [Bacteroidaceae bacterium]
MEGKKQLKGFPLSFNIYAEDEREVKECRAAIIAFIGLHASQCRAVTAKKVSQALSNWDKNPIVRNHIINYFK